VRCTEYEYALRDQEIDFTWKVVRGSNQWEMLPQKEGGEADIKMELGKLVMKM
jgi:hypothetical protein